MTPALVIAALAEGSATPEQLDWANRRVSVLTENAAVFGELSPEEQQELDALLAALDVDWDGGSLDDSGDLSN